MKRILWSSLLATICTTGLIGGLEPTAGASLAQTPPDSPPGQLRELPLRARSQIDALAAAKVARTPAQRKVESTLLTAAQLRGGRGMPGGAPVRSGVRVDASGRTTVDIRGTITSA